ncbi:MAG: hypothetical protein ACLFVU_07225, partial [Phycisphaerae bacterium]
MIPHKRILAALLISAVALGLSGCIPSQKLSEGEMSRRWYLSENPWDQAEPQQLWVSDYPLPPRWVIRNESSVIWSTVQTVREIDALKEGKVRDRAVLAVSPTHAEVSADAIADARQAVEQFRRLADPQTTPARKEWAREVAGATVAAHQAIRRLQPQTEQPQSDSDPLGWTAGPMLELLAGYFNQNIGGQLLGDIAEEDVGNIEKVMVKLITRVSFSIAGKQAPEDFYQKVSEICSRELPEAKKEARLQEAYAEAFASAAPAGPSGRLGSIIHTALSAAPTALRVLENLLRQWEKMDALTLEVRSLGEDRSVVALGLRVKPGKEVTLPELFIMQPEVAIRGHSRIVVPPQIEETGETVVLFEPVSDDGGIVVRFQGIGYALVRLFAIPIRTATLREIRVATASGQYGQEMTTVYLAMEAEGVDDPRRLIVYRDVERMEYVRRAFQLQRIVESTRLEFTYLTPDRRYSYTRFRLFPQE